MDRGLSIRLTQETGSSLLGGEHECLRPNLLGNAAELPGLDLVVGPEPADLPLDGRALALEPRCLLSVGQDGGFLEGILRRAGGASEHATRPNVSVDDVDAVIGNEEFANLV